jgi:hypothetical protein
MAICWQALFYPIDETTEKEEKTCRCNVVSIRADID